MKGDLNNTQNKNMMKEYRQIEHQSELFRGTLFPSHFSLGILINYNFKIMLKKMY